MVSAKSYNSIPLHRFSFLAFFCLVVLALVVKSPARHRSNYSVNSFQARDVFLWTHVIFFGQFNSLVNLSHFAFTSLPSPIQKGTTPHVYDP
jgi:hypothetical protein